MHIFHDWRRIKDTYENTVYECIVCEKLKVVPYKPVYGSARPPKVTPPPKNVKNLNIVMRCKCGHPIPPPIGLIINTFWSQRRATRILEYKCHNCNKINKLIG